MTQKDIYQLAIKIIGIYFGFNALNEIINISIFYIPTSVMYSFQAILSSATRLALAWLAIFKTEFVIDRLGLKTATQQAKTSHSLKKDDVLEISLAIVSILLIAFSIPALINSFIGLVYFQDRGDFAVPSASSLDTGIYFNLARLGIGIFLLVNARNFSKKIISRGKYDDQLDL